MNKKIQATRSPLFLAVRAVRQGEMIAEALCKLPQLSRQMANMGFHLMIEQDGDADFYADMLAYAIVDGQETARGNISVLSALFDQNADKLGMRECIIQASTFDEHCQTPCDGLTIHWSARRVANESRIVGLDLPKKSAG